MKICVTSQGRELSSQVDSRFGRARYFVIYDDEAESFEVIDNEENLNAAGGAGVQSATAVAESGCEWVIGGHMGPKAMSVLQSAGVRVATGASGSVADAIAAFKDGRLEEATGADAAPHW